jgi:hypothetical protein
MMTHPERRHAMTAEAPSPGQLTSEDIDYAAMALDAAQLARLVGERGECVFTWTSREGYPVGVMVAYVYRDGTFWTNCAGRKKRLRALRARPQSAVVVSKDGHTATFKGDSVIHSRNDDGWDALTRWFYPALAGVAPRSGDPFVRGLLRYLDAPHQAIIETPASLVVSFDFGKFNSAVQAAIAAGLQQSQPTA